MQVPDSYCVLRGGYIGGTQGSCALGGTRSMCPPCLLVRTQRRIHRGHTGGMCPRWHKGACALGGTRGMCPPCLLVRTQRWIHRGDTGGMCPRGQKGHVPSCLLVRTQRRMNRGDTGGMCLRGMCPPPKVPGKHFFARFSSGKTKTHE